MNRREQRLARARKIGVEKYGKAYVNMGDGTHYRLNVVRTPSLMLDYKLGIGGFPYGHAVEVYGANRIGKSSAIGYGTLGNVQRELDEYGVPKIPALIAVEPRMVTPEDREWGLKLGFDPDDAIIWYPDNAEEAFDMLRELVFRNLAHYIMIDSLGGMGTEAGTKEDGKKKAFGISGEATAGLNDIMPRLWKNNIGLLVLNQQRQGQSSTPGVKFYDSPGGEALRHHMRIRIHLKPGTQKWTAKIDDESVVVGRELKCVMRKNNMSQAQEKEAQFNFFHIETAEYGFGIDTTQDVINVGMVAGVMQKDGSNYLHSTFPNGKLYGKPKVNAFLKENPDAYEKIRDGVMQVMMQNEIDAAERKEALKDAEITVEAQSEDEIE